MCTLYYCSYMRLSRNIICASMLWYLIYVFMYFIQYQNSSGTHRTALTSTAGLAATCTGSGTAPRHSGTIPPLVQSLSAPIGVVDGADFRIRLLQLSAYLVYSIYYIYLYTHRIQRPPVAKVRPGVEFY